MGFKSGFQSYIQTNQGLFAFIILLLSIAILLFLTFTGSKVEKLEKEIISILVNVVRVEKTKTPLQITAYGVVQANREVTIRPEVTGIIVEQSDNLTEGGIVKRDEVIVRIDPRDYLNLVEQAKAEVEKMQSEFQIEQGKQIVAKREWEELQPSIATTELSEELALRKPHIREKEAALEAAKSKLEKAKLDLERTTIRSPMEAIVLQENAEPGEYVTPQSTIAHLAAVDEFQVLVSIPIDKLRWISIPGTHNPKGAKVKVIQELGEQKPIVKQGEVMRLLADLDPNGRMARLLITIQDPLGIKEKRRSLPLLIGSYVRVMIQGPLLKNIILLPRIALRENNQVWVKNDKNQLEIRKIVVIAKDEQNIMISDGLKEGEEVVLSHIEVPLPGMSLQSVENR